MEDVTPTKTKNVNPTEDDKGGVIVLIYATPDEVPQILLEHDLWGYVYRQHYKRMCWIRFVRRPVKPREDPSDWLCDRDLGVAFVELDGIPHNTEEQMHIRCRQTGFLANDRKTLVQWIRGIGLQDMDTREMDPPTAVRVLDKTLVEYVCAALPCLHAKTDDKTRKRNMNSAKRQMESAIEATMTEDSADVFIQTVAAWFLADSLRVRRT